MDGLSTVRPVFVQYQVEAEPSDLHPDGVPFGATFEAASPELAWAFHPDAVILRYADGLPYNDRAAKREVKEASQNASGSSQTDEIVAQVSEAPATDEVPVSEADAPTGRSSRR